MITKRWRYFGGALLIVVAGVIVFLIVGHGNGTSEKTVKPVRGDIQLTVSTVGMVQPQNRLEIKPPISGRVETILVREGDAVHTGDILALMSSTERATLIDAARLKGNTEFRYWQNVYKETPLVAPIDGIVIVRDVEPGQTVTAGDAVLVLSNRLIVEADVDETDVGGIALGQPATIGLDAYPDITMPGVVDHISYESEIVNNVTIYKVDVMPSVVPDVFRSGMSTNVTIVVQDVHNALLIPTRAVSRHDGQSQVMVKATNGDARQVPVETGVEDDGFVQIVSGLQDADTVIVPNDYYDGVQRKDNSNPFLPSFKRDRKK